jgi:hypothetical protein
MQRRFATKPLRLSQFMITPTPVPQPRNQLLTLLSAEEQQRLLPALRTVRLDLHQVLYDPHSPLDYVYFPSMGAVVSMIMPMENGDANEIATIGF